MAWKNIDRSHAKPFTVFIFEGRIIGGFFLFTLLNCPHEAWNYSRTFKNVVFSMHYMVVYLLNPEKVGGIFLGRALVLGENQL